MAGSLRGFIESLFVSELKGLPWLREDGSVNYRLFSWPPDAFAIAATVLRDSGAYLQVARPHNYPAGDLFQTERWMSHVDAVAKNWRSQDYTTNDPPHPICELLDEIGQHALKHDLAQLSRPHRDNLTWLPFVKLMCLADHASRGAGVLFLVEPMASTDAEAPAAEEIASISADYPRDSVVLRQCGLIFDKHVSQLEAASTDAEFTPLTLCHNVRVERAIVLPKMRTSQRGVTIRSLSLHLALLNGSDVEPLWSPSSYTLLESPGRKDRPHTDAGCSPDYIRDSAGPYNILVLPWPEEILPKQFQPLDVPLSTLAGRPTGRDSFFSFQHAPVDPGKLREHLKKLLAEAEKHVGIVHGVVMPEMSLERTVFDQCFKEKPLDEIHFLVAGVYERPAADSLGRNYAIVQRWIDRGEVEIQEQEKHHRWALDGGQLAMYALGSSLRSDKTWWEGINIPRRRLCFFGLDSFNSFTVLICEDLARPDPVGDAVRAVGPNLVLCLLMDGPQLATRWSARYSTVLADDPGSSVLTVSSVGMVNLSRLREKLHERSRVVCLWREPERAPVELTLEDDARALLLSLASEPRTETTIDGRNDCGMASVLRLAGVHQLGKPPVASLL